MCWKQKKTKLKTKEKQKSSDKIITAPLRCLAESNRLERFCRPLPNRSDKAPVSCFI